MAESTGAGYTLIFADTALDDLLFHKKVGNMATIKRIDRILQELETNPFVGIGKPHELLYDYAGKWSRHLNKKDVIVYEVDESVKIVKIYYLDK